MVSEKQGMMCKRKGSTFEFTLFTLYSSAGQTWYNLDTEETENKVNTYKISIANRSRYLSADGRKTLNQST